MAVEPVPLFPLHTVLFPRMPLRLRVFEERYQRMINRCIEERREFGVSLIQEGAEVGGPAKPHDVGCRARILAVERLAEGRMNLLVEGTSRFRLLDYVERAEPYLVGITEAIQDESASRDSALELAGTVSRQFHAYFRLLTNHAGVKMPEYELPADPEEFSFVIAAVVQATPQVRQEMLCLTDTVARLAMESDILQRDLQRVRRLSRPRVLRARRMEPTSARPFISPN